MIKAKQTKNVLPTKSAAIAADFVHWYTMQKPSEYTRLMEQLERYKNTNEQYRAQVRERIQKLRETKEEYKRIEIELSKVDKDAVTKEAQTLVSQLENLAFVESVKIRGDRVFVRTRLIFTNIRTGDGHRRTKRTCIGAFEIQIRLTQYHQLLRIKNLVFPSLTLSHWSIREMRPCLGDWQAQFNTFFEKRDVLNLLITLYSYLRSTDDAGAYTRSHRWKDARKDALKSSNRLPIGSHCILVSDINDDDGSLILAKGSLGTVLSVVVSSSVLVEYKNAFSQGHNGNGAEVLGKNGHCWYTDTIQLQRVTKAQYEKNITLVKLDEILDKLDKLPEGSTLSDARKILKK